MHIIRGTPGLRTRKPKVKITKAKMADFKERYVEHNRSLKQRGDAQISFEQFLDFIYGKTSIKGVASIVAAPTVFSTTPYRRETPVFPSLNTDAGSCAKAEPKVYTGDAMLGIAMMHKSNLVPVFSNKEAEDVSKMRRG